MHRDRGLVAVQDVNSPIFRKVLTFKTKQYESMNVITKKKHGVLTHVIVGWIAAPIPLDWAAKHAEMRGISLKANSDGMVDTYYDIAIDNRCILHVIKELRSSSLRPYFFEEYPF